jgi:L-ascorbate metabolism protein UlaG (beta-lactamase superfamily)
MRLRWYGQSAFLLEGEEGRVMVDPFGDPSPLRARGVPFAYPPIERVEADLVLVTHEHADHNAVDVVAGDPPVVRLAGAHETPIGPVLGVASEHDDVAGTRRGPNAIFAFRLDELRVCHMGDFGQRGLREEQLEVLGAVDVLLAPAGGGPTIGGEQAAAAARELGASWIVPMHYGTPAAPFLGPLYPLLDALDRRVDVRRIDGQEVELSAADRPQAPQLLMLAPPAPVEG